MELKLGDRPLASALPFDVPVFLHGTAPERVGGLVLHVFSAKRPLRVEERCASESSPEPCRDADRQLFCYLQGGGAPKGSQTSWPLADLDAQASGEETACSLWPRASIWKAADPADKPFTLRVPPQPANTYLVLRIDIEKEPTPAQLAALRTELFRAVDEAVAAFRLEPPSDFTPWTSALYSHLCEGIEEAGRKQGVKFDLKDESPLDCEAGSGKLSADFVARLNSDYSGIRQSLRDIRDAREALDAKVSREKTPLLFDLQKSLGPEVNRLDDPGLVVVPSAALADAIEGLEREADLLERELKADAGALQSIDVVKSSLEELKADTESIGGLVAFAKAVVDDVVQLEASNIGSFLTRQKSYISADFGVLYAHDVEQALPYLGTNVYFVPVNKQAPLSLRQGWPWKRAGATLGVTLGEFDTPRAEPLFSDMNLVVGLGARVTESIRVGAGVVVFREKDADPLADDKKAVYSPYYSLSFDYDVSGLIKWFSKLWT